MTTALAVLAGSAGRMALAAEPEPPRNAASGPQDVERDDRTYPDEVPENERRTVLGPRWKDSQDIAWTTTGDSTGFHLLVADQKDGYSWKTAATLSEPGIDSDTWIGNACVTGAGTRAVVAYAPRTFTNKPDLMARGAFTAVVDLTNGEVSKLKPQASLAYFSPSCGTGDTALLSQFTDEQQDKNATRIITVDTRSKKTTAAHDVPGQVTSAVPVGDVIVAADGNRLIRLGADGRRTTLAATDGVPFSLTADRNGGLTFLDRPRQPAASGASPRGAARQPPQAAVEHLSPAGIVKADGAAKSRTVATGDLTGIDLTSTSKGEVLITGKARNHGALPDAVKNPGVGKDATASTHGAAVVQSTRWADGKDSRIQPQEAQEARPARIDVKVLATGRSTTFDADPTAAPSAHAAQGTEASPALTASGTSQGVRLASSGISEPDRSCAVPRGDPKKQAFQPKPRQIEWAVDQAVTGNLDKHISRPKNWKNTGMGAYRPQSLFPLTPLKGGGRIPAQIMLGVTAQESNMWQATRFAVPGVSANPLIGNYYGTDYSPSGEQKDPWAINWKDSDCGYGITQMTDGMRLAGKTKPGETALPKNKQEAVALDYTANIAAGVNVLAEKWNQTHDAGMTVNGGSPTYMENWFFALWAYNAGFYEKKDAAKHKGKWGVGFTNNPANPLWQPNRTPFLENASGRDDYSHAARPQNWPYQEKVIGWAARPLEALEEPGKLVHGFRPAWWTDSKHRTTAKPPADLFCDASNACDPGLIKEGATNEVGQGPCNRKDLHCWWNKSVEWKKCLDQCGFELLRFNDTYKEEADGNAYPPRCDPGLPAGSLIVDNLDNGTTPVGSGSRSCGAVKSAGSFSFAFGSPNAKVDTHQIGAGFGNHFWFAHTRDTDSSEGRRMEVKGTWTLGQKLNGWSRVMVHMPDHGAHTRQAKYVIDTGSGAKFRVAPQRTQENRWVDLGVFKFAGTPKVSLSTRTKDGYGSEDVAWDAVAFQKLPGRPKHQIVALGDSYSSGEGASKSGGGDYYKETNYFNKVKDTVLQKEQARLRNACHRSTHAWSRQATMPGESKAIGALADARHPGMDYHLIACSGAQTENILGEDDPKNSQSDTDAGHKWGGKKAVDQYGELPQLDQGYLDENTTLVTISIGGNDTNFTKVFTECIALAGLKKYQDAHLGDDPRPMKEHVPDIIAKEVRPSLVTTLEAIHKKAPHARTVLMGYPPLLERNGQCIPGIGTAEGPWLNSIADLLLTQMDNAVQDARKKGVEAWFSNPKSHFAGKAICGKPETIHGIVTDTVESDDAPLSAQSFHPKIEGARLYANSLEQTLKGMGR